MKRKKVSPTGFVIRIHARLRKNSEKEPLKMKNTKFNE